MLLEIKNISFSYNKSSAPVFENMSISIECGDLIVISGPSGSGKSSLLRLLNRLHDPTDGVILFDGRPLTDHNTAELRRQVCYLRQTPLMIEGTIRDNLVFPFSFRSAQGAAPPPDGVLVDLLKRFGLPDMSLLGSATELSVGQKQRLAFIRALLLKPKVLLLDEPISALDPGSRAVAEEYIEKSAVEQNMAVIMVTHLDFSPRHLKVRKYLLGHGELRGLA